MATVELALPHHRYSIHIEPGALDTLGEGARACARSQRCALVIDANVVREHGVRAERSIREAGLEPVVSVLPSGEETKSLAQIARLYETWVEAGLERGSPVIALGGGVTGDTAGFAAASFLRGVPFLQCPTTLLAMVDSSVGGKVGVNLPKGKNLVGAFHQPAAVLIDPDLLRTLPARELRAGLAECIKHGAIRDEDLLEWTAKQMERLLALECDALVELVTRNVEIKASVVCEDERESGVRAHLNFGHTFGHAIESTRGYGVLLHGEAVGLGMRAAAWLAERMGLCGPEVADRLRSTLAAAGLPVRTELTSADELRAALRVDKKVVGGRLRFVLPRRIGAVEVRDDAPLEAVDAAWDTIRT